jgi:hypothetical protein
VGEQESVSYRLLGEYADLYARWCAEYWDEPRVAQAFLWAQFEGRSAQSAYDDAVPTPRAPRGMPRAITSSTPKAAVLALPILIVPERKRS